MNIRRKEILKELGLLPQWHNTPDNPIDSTPGTRLIKKEHIEEKLANNITDEARRARILEMNWDQLKKAVVNCTACTLCQARTHTVFGTGDQNADWLCIGEGPGAREDVTGEAFAGQAGKLLDNMLMAIGLQRGQHVYITNVVKCRPPNNRNPNSIEIQQCEPHLARQVALIKPKIIIALGKIAAQSLLGLDANVSSLRGKLHLYSGIPLIVTYHPAYLLRSLSDKEKTWEDLCFAKATMQSLT